MAWVATAVVGGAVIGGAASLIGSGQQADAARDAANTSAEAAKYQADIQKQIYDQARADQGPWRETGAGALAMLSEGLGVAPNVDRERFRTGTTQRNLGLFTLNSPTYNEAAYQAAVESAKRAPGFGSLMRPFSMADYEADPGYAFRRDEGLKALDRTAAARGGALSGAALRGAERYGQGLASEEYGNAFNRYQTNQANRFNRLASLAGVGQTANAATGAAGANYANAITGISQADATNQGNALLAAGNARASGYQGLGNALGGAGSNYFLLKSLMR